MLSWRNLFLAVGGCGLLSCSGPPASTDPTLGNPEGDVVPPAQQHRSRIPGDYEDVFASYLTQEMLLVPADTWHLSLTGTVVDKESGRPVEGAEVSYSWPFLTCTGHWLFVLDQRSVITDADGRFLIDVPGAQVEEQLQFAKSVPRTEAEDHDSVFGRFSVNVQHPDYLSTGGTWVVPKTAVVIELGCWVNTMELVLQAVDGSSGEPVLGAWVVLDLLRDPPFPAGPQRLALPVNLRSDPFPVRAKVGADGYRPIEVEWDPGAGTHRRVFELERVESP